MKNLIATVICIVTVFSFVACGNNAQSSEDSVDSTSESAQLPEYSIVNTSEYVRDGKTCQGYRVVVNDDTTEDEMRAVFDEICKSDGYYLHTVWFYSDASDVDTIGMYTVGMLEEVKSGQAPQFTQSTLTPDLIARFRADT